MSTIRKFGSKDMLKNVVASVLEDLGFKVEVEKEIPLKTGEYIRGVYRKNIVVDILGRKHIEDTILTVYVSCYNRTEPVGVYEIKEEYEKIIRNMDLIPHIRVFVANSFLENAKMEATKYGFVVIEIGELVTESNAEKVYQKVYEKFNKLFAGVTPKWMQDLAEKVKKTDEEIKKIGEELEKAVGEYKF
jgi:hypothetical protein